jgi:hypothetical protein
LSTRIVAKGISAAAAILMFMNLSGYRHETLISDCTTTSGRKGRSLLRSGSGG